MVPQILSILYFLHREQNYWSILSVLLPFVSLVLHAQNRQYTVYTGMVFFLCFNSWN